jgi:hypothetical protein
MIQIDKSWYTSNVYENITDFDRSNKGPFSNMASLMRNNDLLSQPTPPPASRAHIARWCSQYKTKEVSLLQRKPSYCFSKTKLLLLEELNNAGIVAVRVFAVYDATKALTVLR